MPENHNDSKTIQGDSRESRIDELVAEYLRLKASGDSPSRSMFLRAHPEFSEQLSRLIAEPAQTPTAADSADGVSGGWVNSPTLSIGGRRGTETAERSFGEYELEERLAEGGMGVVYRARQANLRRTVALKMILAGELASTSAVARFRQEAAAAAQLEHPNIVPIFEVGECDGRHYFTMGYVGGGSLADRLKQGPLPPRRAAEIVRAVATAVAFAHERGIIHRDLKPANVLLESDGSPKVADFGLAKHVHAEGNDATRTGDILGTPSYMAPEQATQSRTVGPAADVYSLGAILYACLVGRPPFQAATVLETLQQVKEQDPAPPSRLNRNLPRDLDTICLTCLEKQPEKRYASAAALSEELERFLDGRPILARPLRWWQRGWRVVRRNPRASAAMTLAAVLAISAGGKAAWRERQLRLDAEDKADLARKETERANQQERLALQREAEGRRLLYDSRVNLAANAWRAGNYKIMRDLLDRMVPRDKEADHRGFEWNCLDGLFHRGRESLAFKPFLRAENGRLFGEAAPRPAAVSSDASVVAYITRSGAECEVGHFGAPDRVRIRTDWHFVSVQLSSDGTLLAALEDAPGGTARRISTWDCRKGTKYASVDGIPASATDMTINLSPTGEAVAVAGLQKIDLFNARTGARLRTLRTARRECTSLRFSPNGKRIALLTSSLTFTNGDFLGALFSSKTFLLQLFDVFEDTAPLTIQNQPGEMTAIEFSPDGGTLAAAVAVPRESDLPSSYAMRLGAAAGSLLYRVAPNVVLRNVASEVLLLNSKTGDVQGRLKGDGHVMTRLAFAADGSRMAAGSLDSLAAFAEDGQETSYGKLYCWDLKARRLLWTHPVPGGPASLHLLKDRTVVASAAASGGIGVFDANSGRRTATLVGHLGGVRELRSNGDFLVSWSDDQTISRWDLKRMPSEILIRDVNAGGGFVAMNLAFSDDGKKIFASSASFGGLAAAAYDVEKREALEGYGGLPIAALAISRDGKRYAGMAPGEVLSTGARSIHVREAGSDLPIRSLQAPAGRMPRSVSFSADGLHLAAIVAAEGVAVWSLESGERLSIPIGIDPSASCVAFSPTEQLIAVHSLAPLPNPKGQEGNAADRYRIDVWDLRSREKKQSFTSVLGPFTSMQFSQDGKRVLASSGTFADGKPGNVVVWDLETGAEKAVLRGHAEGVSAVACSPDGRTIATSSWDRTVNLWDAESGSLLMTLDEHTDAAVGVAFDPAGRKLAAAFGDGVIKIWRADPRPGGSKE